MTDAPENPPPGGPEVPVEGVGDALRTAVERTLAATADSATGTRQRAQGLLDDVVRRGQVAREQVTKRGEEATSRLADAISELRSADDEGIQHLTGRLEAVERRLAAVEVELSAQSNPLVEVERNPADPQGQRDSSH